MFRMTVDDVFMIRGRGLVATGTIESGTVRKGDEVTVDGLRTVRIDAIEKFRKKLDEASAGDLVGLLIKDATKDDIDSGTVLTGDRSGGGVSIPGLGLS